MKIVPQPPPCYVAIVERAYRGLIEQQYGNIIWMTECVQRMGARVNLVLKGYAVLHAAAVADHGGNLMLAGLFMDSIGNTRLSLRQLQAAGATVFVYSDDWEVLAPGPLIDGVQFITRTDLSRLIADADQAWYY